MDDLLDLSWSSPSSSKAPPPSLQPRQPLAFDFLSKQAQPAANYQIPPPVRTSTPSNALPRQSGTSTPQLTAVPPTSTSDAFSSLFSLDITKGSSAKLSLAERQAQMAADLKRKEEHDRQQFEAHGAFWDNLGEGSGSGPAKQSSAGGKGLNGFEDLLNPVVNEASIQPPAKTNTHTLVAPAAKSGKPPMGSFWSMGSAKAGSNTSVYEDEDDGLLGFTSTTTQPKALTSKLAAANALKTPVDLFDFDDMDSAVPSLAVAGGSREGGSSGMRTPVSDFDFGDGERVRSERVRRGMKGEDAMDILGDLARPVQAKVVVRDEQHVVKQSSGPTRPSRTASPPPHIVGHIVEMGFSPIQARTALAKTSTGLDVEAALEILLGSATAQSGSRSDDETQLGMERERERREEEERERRRRRRAGPSRDTVKPRTRDHTEERDTGASTPEFGEQADRILAQASEIGQSVLSKATSFWNTGKDKALKAYEEQQRRAAEASKGRSGEEGRDGRPRWMTEVDGDNEGNVQGESGGFRDDDEVLPQRPTVKVNRESSRAKAPHVAEAKPEQQYQSTRGRADLLFAEEPISYKPANRHRKPTPELTTTVSRPSTPARPPTPLVTRRLVQASPSQIANSARYKAAGNEHYKLGRFTEANSTYTTAITSLPEGHILLIPIYNNRAATRLKLGESAAAIEDCTIVIEAIGLGFSPQKESPLPAEFSEVKLGEGLVKAVTKRAQAWEMAEKWRSAVEDWERVMGLDAALLGGSAAATRTLAVEGARRSRRMLAGRNAPQSATNTPRPTPSIKPTSRPAVTASTPADPDRSQAVTALRQANMATEAEDTQKLALKDSVDARLLAWRGGKEANLRALISSLNTVLWDEILAGGLKVGMHELISEKQVKIKYMKVIARLHPDKLILANTSVEQRMLANGAFGALNDAWQAFNNA